MKNSRTARKPRVAPRTATVAVSILLVLGFASTAFAGPGTRCGDAKKAQENALMAVSQSGKAYLGVTMQELNDEVLKGLDVKVKNGVLVTEVIEDSPADEAGIESGDIIVEFNGKRVDSPSELRRLVEKAGAGESVKVKVVRDNDSKTVAVTIGEWPEKESWALLTPDSRGWFGEGKDMFVRAFGRGRLGVQATDLNEGLAPYFGVGENDGVLVLDVTEGSPADEMGIKAGDVIVKVADEEVGSVEELVDAVGELEAGEKFEVTLVRSKEKKALQGEMGEDLGKVRFGRFSGPSGVRVPKVDMYKFSEDEMKELREEMKTLKEELKDLKKELEKVKKST